LYTFGAPTAKPIQLYSPEAVQLKEPDVILDREAYIPTARTLLG